MVTWHTFWKRHVTLHFQLSVRKIHLTIAHGNPKILVTLVILTIHQSKEHMSPLPWLCELHFPITITIWVSPYSKKSIQLLPMAIPKSNCIDNPNYQSIHSIHASIALPLATPPTHHNHSSSISPCQKFHPTIAHWQSQNPISLAIPPIHFSTLQRHPFSWLWHLHLPTLFFAPVSPMHQFSHHTLSYDNPKIHYLGNPDYPSTPIIHSWKCQMLQP